MKNKYTIPKINKTNPNGWYIGFSFNGKSIRIKKNDSHDFNRIKDLKEREFEMEAMTMAIKIRLRQGWNPLTQSMPNQSKPINNKTISEALTFAMEKKSNSLVK